jgi:hypothetical protein
VLHEVAKSTVDRCLGDGCRRNTTTEDHFHLTIVSMGLFMKSASFGLADKKQVS